LSIQSNRITKIEGLESLTALEELYLSHNGLTKIEGLENNVSLHDRSVERRNDAQLRLRTLDVGNNAIEEIENISHLSELEEFWVSLTCHGALSASLLAAQRQFG
jgi:protein phosphatase 1 regulatory subunit 7